MPEFILNTPARRKPPHPYYALSDFAKGYVEAMFFTNGDTGDERENLLNDWGVECLTREACADIAKDCARFQEENAVALQFLYNGDFADKHGPYNEQRAGNDFWFTRQGHGVGYCDRYHLPEFAREPLAYAAREFGEAHVEAYRKKIHHR